MAETFRAVVVKETGEGFVRETVTRTVDELPDGEVLIRVLYSSLNYKDALSATGNRGVTKRYPHTPGIDAVGEVAASDDDAFAPGDVVTVTGYDLGMNTDGGWGEMIRVPAGWPVPLPKGLTPRESMAIGTAGLTAALSVSEVEGGEVDPDAGPVLVTGATGGVGSHAVAILAQAGYAVTAVTGKAEAHDFLKDLGATEVIGRDDVDEAPDRPMGSGRWAAVVDTVGGGILAGALKHVKPRGVATCCGLVASPNLETTMFPFILRGVRLVGIDSAECPIERRRLMWERLAGDWKAEKMDRMYRVVSLDALDPEIDRILGGGSVGRVVVKVGR